MQLCVGTHVVCLLELDSSSQVVASELVEDSHVSSETEAARVWLAGRRVVGTWPWTGLEFGLVVLSSELPELLEVLLVLEGERMSVA